MTCPSRTGTVALAFALCVVTRATADDFNPYVIPREQFATRVHTIALVPVSLPAEAPNPEAVGSLIEGMVAETVRAKGYAVVDSSVWAIVWRRMSEQVGGTYDPMTGSVRQEAFKAVWEHTSRELARLHGVDAILTASVSQGRAPFGRDFFSGYATWDEWLTWRGERIGPHIMHTPQLVLGTYQDIVIRDLAGTKLYGISVGIQWTTVYIARGYERRPLGELYSPAHLRKAIDTDLEPLIHAKGKSAP